MASSSTSSPYPKRKRAQVSYAEINSDVVDLDNSQSDADAVAPPAKRSKKPAWSKKPARSRSGRIFPFLDLPIELRDQIYRETLTDSNGVYLASKTWSFRRTIQRVTPRTGARLARRQSRRRLHYWQRATTTPEIDLDMPDGLRPFIPALLGVSKTVKAEAEQWLYSHNEFIVEDTTILHDFVAGLTTSQRELLRRITVKKWGHSSADKAMNFPAFSILAQGGTNLRSLRLDCFAHWGGGKRVARQLYCNGFHWLEAMARTRDADAVVDVLDMSEQTWTISGAPQTFRKELKKLMGAEKAQLGGKSRKDVGEKRKGSKKISEDEKAWRG